MAYASRQTQAEGMRANQLSGQDECDVEVNVMQKGQSGAFTYNWLETLLCLMCAYEGSQRVLSTEYILRC